MDDMAIEMGKWTIKTSEISAGVYAVDAKHASGTTFSFKGTSDAMGESFLRSYASAAEKSRKMTCLQNLGNWSIETRQIAAEVLMVEASHYLGPKVSFRATNADDAISQLTSYASDLEKTIANKRR